jgi:hypothetical protein
LNQFSNTQLSAFAASLDNDMSAFFDVDSWKDIYILKHDNANLSAFVADTPLFPDIPSGSLDLSVFQPFVRFEKTYRALSIYLERCNLAKYLERGDQIQRVKRKNGVFGFDETLC